MAGTLLRFTSGLRGLRMSWLTVGIRLLDPVCPNKKTPRRPGYCPELGCARLRTPNPYRVLRPNAEDFGLAPKSCAIPRILFTGPSV
ncbi:MAG: hypothetical protein RIC82_07295 [Parvibaculum sp.]